MKMHLALILAWLVQTTIIAHGQDRNFKFFEAGTILIPRELELLEGQAKIDADSFYVMVFPKSKNATDPNLIEFRQAGLAANDPNAFKDFARIIIGIELLSTSSPLYASQLKSISQNELLEASSVKKQQYLKSVPSSTRILSWSGYSVKKINGIYVLSLRYVRQVMKMPPTEVEELWFYNGVKAYKVSFAYNTERAGFWKPLMEKSLNSIRFLIKFK